MLYDRIRKVANFSQIYINGVQNDFKIWPSSVLLDILPTRSNEFKSKTTHYEESIKALIRGETMKMGMADHIERKSIKALIHGETMKTGMADHIERKKWR